METISMEEIERMEDFIFHLSDSQMKEWKANLKAKQPLVYHLFAKPLYKNDTTIEIDIMFRIAFVVLKCFDVYGIELPAFTPKEIDKADSKWKSLMLQGIGEIHRVNLVRVGATVNQGVISGYIHDKFMEKDAPTNQDSYTKTEIRFNTLCFIVLMYGSKIEDQLRRQKGSKPKE